jgi:PAS domain S-box-containing protein
MDVCAQLFESLPDAVMVVAARGSIRQVNPAAARLFGFAADDLVGLPVEAVLPAWRRRCPDAAGAATVRDLGPGLTDDELATVGLRRDGSTFTATISLTTLAVDDGPLVVARVRDATAWRQLKKTLRAAQDTAERAGRARTEFLAAMSHELLTPIGVVLGFAHVLLGSGLDAKQRDCATAALNAARDLQFTVNNILDFSTLEDDTTGPENRSFSLQEALDAVLGELASNADAKRLELALSIAPDVPKLIVADSWRLKKILRNLIDNAINFTSKGHIRVGVTAREIGARIELRFAVTDTGIGIPAKGGASLFKAFTQADMSATRRYGGSGLGLAICRRLVEGMDGAIGFDSTVGEGSTFWFSVPVTAAIGAHPVHTIVPSLARESRSRAANPGGPVSPPDSPPVAHILLAEDHPMCQKIAVRLLERLGCRVDVAGDGAQAVEMASQFGYDIIFMDCHMPAMDGIEATREIRHREALAGNRHTPIVALTASVVGEDRHACYAAGMDAFINKPIQPKELGELIQRYAPRHIDGTLVSSPEIVADEEISANDPQG